MEKILTSGRIGGRVSPPCSKSYAQRALAASLLAEGRSVLHNLEFCDDTLSAIRCIETLGASVTRIGTDTLAIDSGWHAADAPDRLMTGALQPTNDTLHTGESGLATRLFTPIAALADRPMRIVGEGSLLHRPMEPMIATLRNLGVRVNDTDGRLPLTVCGPLQGGETAIDGSLSSQFVTGLLLALPLARKDTVLHVSKPVSIPYLDMTLDTAARFGIEIDHRDYEEFYIKGQQCYRPAEIAIEGDWSAAAMLLVAGAVAGEVTV
ncbi:MAG: 3-phosphoshikimate 1-carboxyvinyltransferase, partial [Alistipes sp.]|nr:3-phosphoshikimate 1-carboxyvinyltransferase [Alistipes sp.]